MKIEFKSKSRIGVISKLLKFYLEMKIETIYHMDNEVFKAYCIKFI